MLVEEGKVDLSADVRRYLPWVPDFGKTITVGDLVHHLSGLKDSHLLFWLAERARGDHLTPPRLIAMVTGQRGLLLDPGTRYAYTTTGHLLLSYESPQSCGQTQRST